MIVIPAIDLLNKKCVRLNKGDFEQKKIYGDNPLEVAYYWQKQGAEYIHIVDLDGARSGEPVHQKIITKIAESIDIPVQVGGGIRKLSVMEKYLSSGVQRLTLGTIALKNRDLMRQALKKFSSEKIIVSVDGRDNKVSINGWFETTEMRVDDLIERLTEEGVCNFIFTDIKKDGMMTGPDIDFIKSIKKRNIKLLAAGGIKTVDDLNKLYKAGIDGAIVGRALYEGKIDLQEIDF